MKAEVGVNTLHPLIYAWKQVLTVLRTWMYCKKNGLPCNKWYGVYESGTENIIVLVGPLPGAKERAEKIARLIGE